MALLSCSAEVTETGVPGQNRPMLSFGNQEMRQSRAWTCLTGGIQPALADTGKESSDYSVEVWEGLQSAEKNSSRLLQKGSNAF